MSEQKRKYNVKNVQITPIPGSPPILKTIYTTRDQVVTSIKSSTIVPDASLVNAYNSLGVEFCESMGISYKTVEVIKIDFYENDEWGSGVSLKLKINLRKKKNQFIIAETVTYWVDTVNEDTEMSEEMESLRIEILDGIERFLDSRSRQLELFEQSAKGTESGEESSS